MKHLTLPDVEIIENRETKARSVSGMTSVANHENLKQKVTAIRKSLDVSTHQLLLMLMNETKPEFFSDEYRPVEDWAVYAQFTNAYSSRKAIDMLRESIRKLSRKTRIDEKGDEQ